MKIKHREWILFKMQVATLCSFVFLLPSSYYVFLLIAIRDVFPYSHTYVWIHILYDMLHLRKDIYLLCYLYLYIYIMVWWKIFMHDFILSTIFSWYRMSYAHLVILIHFYFMQYTVPLTTHKFPHFYKKEFFFIFTLKCSLCERVYITLYKWEKIVYKTR
jgi:hypothetical protein